jgi:hypothetical protein
LPCRNPFGHYVSRDGDKLDQKIFGRDEELLIFATRFENNGCGESRGKCWKAGKFFAEGMKSTTGSGVTTAKLLSTGDEKICRKQK